MSQTLKATHFPEIPDLLQTVEKIDGDTIETASISSTKLADQPWVLKEGDTMTGALLIDVDNSDSLPHTYLLSVVSNLTNDFTALNSRSFGIMTNMEHGSSVTDQLLVDIQIGDFTSS